MQPTLTDWNSQLLPSMGRRIMDPEQSTEAMLYLSDKYRIRRFVMMPLYDARQESVPMFLLRRSRSEELMRSQLPQGITFQARASVYLSPNLSETKFLERLRIPRTNYLPIQLPIGEYRDWMDTELNHLLYKSKFHLLLMSFDICPLLYSREVLDRLLRMENAAYHFNYRALIHPNLCRIIATLLLHNKPVLLGTGLDCIEKAYRYEMDYYLSSGSERLTSVLYQRLLYQSKLFPRIV